MPEDVEVEIFGQSFRVAAGDATSAYIQKLAEYVDERMRAIAASLTEEDMKQLADYYGGAK